jgi:hypothetical protein
MYLADVGVRRIDLAHCTAGRDEPGDDLEASDVAREGADPALLDRGCGRNHKFTGSAALLKKGDRDAPATEAEAMKSAKKTERMRAIIGDEG